ncbi:hypothetical protein, partial [Enterococcus faecium]|uniref:hypothetical protein n=1 Tax=Enterococcus faecium TaxID=1352 RepID=UPI0021D5A305
MASVLSKIQDKEGIPGGPYPYDVPDYAGSKQWYQRRVAITATSLYKKVGVLPYTLGLHYTITTQPDCTLPM